MRRRLSLLIAFIGVLGLIGFAPTAEASHDLEKKGGDPSEGTHEQMPAPPDVETPIGNCLVTGNVNVGNASGTGGVGVTQAGSNKSHNHFRFNEAEIVCVSPTDPNFDGTFLVDAAGGTDGPNVDAAGMPADNHGEDAANGWSHSSCYVDSDTTKAPGGCEPPAVHDKGADLDDLYDGTNTMGGANDCNNCGEIEVAQEDGDTASCTPDSRFDGSHECQDSARDNVVMFCRGEFQDADTGNVCPALGGENVIAWGALHGTSQNKKDMVLCFLADLIFTPTNGDGGVTKKFDQALLEGDAIIWLAAGNDKADCFGDPKGKKKE